MLKLLPSHCRDAKEIEMAKYETTKREGKCSKLHAMWAAAQCTFAIEQKIEA